jgi:hypothetical protein
VYEFYNDNVETIELILYSGKAVTFTDVVQLMDLDDKLSNDNVRTIEFIYSRKGFLSRMKTLAKKTIVSLPSMLARLLSRIISTIISWVGLGSVTSMSLTLFKSFVGTKQIMQYVITVIAMFFPMLAPLLGIAKFI